MRLLRWLGWTVAVLGLAYGYFAWLAPVMTVEDHVYFDAPEPWVIAHQGGRGLWPENTMYAFESVKALGVDVLEMDIRVTADGELIVMHDERVDRTTNGTGAVSELTLEEVRQLDAGYRFVDEHGRTSFRGRGLAVPTLEEVLARFEDDRLNLEMKEFTPERAEVFCRTLRKSGATERVLVASFAHPPMKRFRQECPEVATSATLREGLLVFQLNRMGLGSLVRTRALALQLPEHFGELHVVTPDMMRLAREMNMRVQVWTVNEEDAMRRLVGLGVQGILTDYPDRLKRVLQTPPGS